MYDIIAFHSPEGPIVKLSDRYRSTLHKRWDNTLIGVRVVDLKHNFYFVRFSNRQDYMHALTDGPWNVFDHCCTVEPWVPQFNPVNHKIISVVAWAPLEYHLKHDWTLGQNRSQHRGSNQGSLCSCGT
ncbi:hypothetical protein Tsubulata_016178 [Turnera subulata]|uniref:DUF4283 domain-containing protein n=1 Tax=Turnera subulata TaxID=218843 RepID=A0A9Q0GEA5_9ROSI|nr:hypothetical protein Tsubulata_016178 [Turnera subulata]